MMHRLATALYALALLSAPLTAQIPDAPPPSAPPARPGTGRAATPPPAPPPAPAGPAAQSAIAPDTGTILVGRRHLDSLQAVIGGLRHKFAPTEQAHEKYLGAVNLAKWVLGVWFALVLFYLLWAVHRYVYNYGLSNREWKILYPEVYESWFDRWLYGRRLRGWKKRRDAHFSTAELAERERQFADWEFYNPRPQSFRELRDALLEHNARQRSRAEFASGNGHATPSTSATNMTQPFAEPAGNPYQSDSFGLPPGTIRGILALTALVMFLLVEGVNLWSPASLEGQFDGLVTAFQMVLAFYFGSRAVEVLQAKTAAKKDEATAAVATNGAARPAEAVATPVEAPSKIDADDVGGEKAILPVAKADLRFANLLDFAKGMLTKGPGTKALPGSKLTTDTPLATRVLALTAAFETGRGFPECFGGVAGNFDGQGISFGALQWNIGQGSLQPLWKELRRRLQEARREDELKTVFGNLYPTFSRMLDASKEEQMQWALEIQYMVSTRTRAWRIADPWKAALQALGTHPDMINIQVERADALYQVALGFCRDYGLTTERGAALMFDIRVQNGSVDRLGSGEKIRRGFELINPILDDAQEQEERMRIIARERAAVAKAEWREDVLKRKLTIAEGKGVVHNRSFDLEAEFALPRNAPLSKTVTGAIA